MKTKTAVLAGLCGVAALMSAANPDAQTAPNIVFQTTFADADCPYWDQKMGIWDSAVCRTGDGMQGWGGWTTSNGSVDSISAASNFPGGGGGKGYRSMVGTGTNSNGGGLRIMLPYEMKELWVRFYMRHQAGFKWQNDQPAYEKDLYFNDGLANAPVFVVGYSSGLFGVLRVNPGGSHLTGGQSSHWQTINGGPRGDGQFHSFEVHVKQDTNGSNGIAETWVDGQLVARYTNVNWNGSIGQPGWTFFSMAINQHYVDNNGVDMYRDYDDIVVSSSGYIGPVSGGGQSQLPSAPSNLRIAP